MVGGIIPEADIPKLTAIGSQRFLGRALRSTTSSLSSKNRGSRSHDRPLLDRLRQAIAMRWHDS